MSGALDCMWPLPYPRLTYIATELTIWSLAALPGMVISLLVTSIRFGFDLRVSPSVVPSVVLILFTRTTVGTAIGLRSPSAQTTNLFSSFVIIVVLLFSPVSFPGGGCPAGGGRDRHRAVGQPSRVSDGRDGFTRSSTSLAGAFAVQASSSASRRTRLPTLFRWTRNAG